MNSKFASFFFAVLTLVLLSSCRFQTPSAAEQQHLVKTGTFPGNVPPWVMQPRDKGPRVTGSSGYIPQTFSAPAPVRNTQAAIPAAGADADPRAVRPVPGFSEAPESQAVQSAETEQAGGPIATQPQGQTPAEESPLARISKACPAVEKPAAEALQMTNIGERVRRMQQLTTRCPQSPDLWLWLGRDYQAQKRLVEAQRSFEKVLTLDSGNQEAQAQLAAIRQQLNNMNKGKK